MGHKKSELQLTKVDIEGYLEGKYNLTHLALKYDVSRHLISQIMKRQCGSQIANVMQKNSKSGAAKLSSTQLNEIFEKVKSGESSRSLAIKYDICEGTIRYHLKKNGIREKPADRLANDFEVRKSSVISINSDMKKLIPKNSCTNAHKLMTISMRAS